MLKDLLVLAADKDAEYVLRGLLPRHQSLGTRQFTFEIYRHPHHDSGCFQAPERLLQAVGFPTAFRHAVVIFDWHGSGAESKAPQDVAQDVEERLSEWCGTERCACIVIQPELEAWVWSDSPHVDRELGWAGRSPPLRQWMVQGNHCMTMNAKPTDPKTAFKAALREARLPESAAIFRNLAAQVSVERCVDPSFRRLVNVLREWFPVIR